MPNAVIFVLSSELVIQVTSEINKFNTTYKVVSVYGGTSIENQIRDIKSGAAILVATPGRLIDLINR